MIRAKPVRRPSDDDSRVCALLPYTSSRGNLLIEQSIQKQQTKISGNEELPTAVDVGCSPKISIFVHMIKKSKEKLVRAVRTKAKSIYKMGLREWGGKNNEEKHSVQTPQTLQSSPNDKILSEDKGEQTLEAKAITPKKEGDSNDDSGSIRFLPKYFGEESPNNSVEFSGDIPIFIRQDTIDSATAPGIPLYLRQDTVADISSPNLPTNPNFSAHDSIEFSGVANMLPRQNTEESIESLEFAADNNSKSDILKHLSYDSFTTTAQVNEDSNDAGNHCEDDMEPEIIVEATMEQTTPKEKN